LIIQTHPKTNTLADFFAKMTKSHNCCLASNLGIYFIKSALSGWFMPDNEQFSSPEFTFPQFFILLLQLFLKKSRYLKFMLKLGCQTEKSTAEKISNQG